jgi:hypothetical protein
MNKEQTFTDPDTGIRFDWEIINCDSYIDCDIYAVMPTDEEYLLRVYREDASRSPFVGPFEEGCVRYSRNRVDCFDDEPPPDQLPESLRSAFVKIEPDVRALINSKLEDQ